MTNTPVSIEDLRELRRTARRLNSSAVGHLQPFQKPDGSFKTLPDSKIKKHAQGHPDIPDVSVGSTATVMMAALGAGKIEHFFGGKRRNVNEVFEDMLRSEWGSSGLDDGNAFTAAMLVRTAGLLVAAGAIDSSLLTAIRHPEYPIRDSNPNISRVADKSLQMVMQERAQSIPDAFAVGGYPPKTTLAYWFVDGVAQSGTQISTWEQIAEWSSREFHRELSYVSAGNDALMDPPALAMAACVISCVRRVLETDQGIPKATEILRMLPTRTELIFGIEQVFSTQAESGIWHKYFPLFHFPGGMGAADYCFSFEFLEAILIEFGSVALNNSKLLAAITKALRWCEDHELGYRSHDGNLYTGWNAGGEVRNLVAGKPESWATATVHMFLSQLDRRTSELLDSLVLKRFGVDRSAISKSSKRLDHMIDIPLTFPGEPETTLKTVLRKDVLAHAESLSSEDLLSKGIGVPRSAVLFGPPGTSKTQVSKPMAEYLGWPRVVITPSEFLGQGIEQVHAKVDEVFRNLMDLIGAVVLFDEMDALAQTREGEAVITGKKNKTNENGRQPVTLDVTRQLLTTSMLPKLANLWDQNRVIFLLATNHKEQLDPAITRPNRFDLLLFIKPPLWKDKSTTESLSRVYEIPDASKVKTELSRLVSDGSSAQSMLDALTVTELGSFLEFLRRSKKVDTVLAALKQHNKTSFNGAVKKWVTAANPQKSKSEDSGGMSRRQYYSFADVGASDPGS